MANFLVAITCITLVSIWINKPNDLDANPISGMSSEELAKQIKGLADDEDWYIYSTSGTERMASEAITYDKEIFGHIDHVIAIRVNSMTVITWIVGQGGAAKVAHVRMYGDSYDLGYEKLFGILRPLVPFSSAGGPQLESKSGEQ
jgi:hypothetical protein